MMGILVSNGAQCVCTMGTAPSSLMVLPESMAMGQNNPIATIMDNKPMVNIMPFAMCTSMANPQVSAATSAAGGVLTPMPCTPVTTSPWTPGCPSVIVANKPALNNSSTLMCNWGGMISITNPSTTTVMVP